MPEIVHVTYAMMQCSGCDELDYSRRFSDAEQLHKNCPQEGRWKLAGFRVPPEQMGWGPQ